MAAPPDLRLLFSLITKAIDYPLPAIPPIVASFVPSPKSDLLISKAHELFYFSTRVEMGKVSNWLETQETDLLTLVGRIQAIEDYLKPSASITSSFLHAVTSLYPDFKGAKSSDKDPDAYRIFRDFIWVTNQIDLKWKHLVQSFIGFRGMIGLYETKTSQSAKKLISDLHGETFVSCPILTGLRNWAEMVVETLFPATEAQRCSLCNEVLKCSQKPVALPCAHSFCFRCVLNHFETKSQSCPQCKRAEHYNSSQEINFAVFEPWSIISRSLGIFRIRRLQLQETEAQSGGSGGGSDKSPFSRGLLHSLQNFLQIRSQMLAPPSSSSSSTSTLQPPGQTTAPGTPETGYTPMQIFSPSSSSSTSSSSSSSSSSSAHSPVSPVSSRDGTPSPTPSPTESLKTRITSPEPMITIDQDQASKLKKSPPAGSKKSPTGEGRVVDGRRVLNTSCHQCKSSKEPSKLVFCTRPPGLDKKRRCRKKYCFVCLQRLYGWQKPTKAEQSQWQCPSCLLLCKCAKCRREVEKSGLQPPTEFLKVPSPTSNSRPPLNRYLSDPGGTTETSTRPQLSIDTLVRDLESPTTDKQSTSPALIRRSSYDSTQQKGVTRRQRSPTQRSVPYPVRPERSRSAEATDPDMMSRSQPASPVARTGSPSHPPPMELNGPRQRRGTWSASDWNQYQLLDAIAAITGHITAGLGPGQATPEFPPVVIQDERFPKETKEPPSLMVPPPLGRPRSAPPGPSPFGFDIPTPPQSPTPRFGRVSPLLLHPATSNSLPLLSSLLSPPTPLVSPTGTAFTPFGQQTPTSGSSQSTPPTTGTPSTSMLPPSSSPRINRPPGFFAPTRETPRGHGPGGDFSPGPLISPGTLISPPVALGSPSLLGSPSAILGGFTPPLTGFVPSFSPTSLGPTFGSTVQPSFSGSGGMSTGMSTGMPTATGFVSTGHLLSGMNIPVQQRGQGPGIIPGQESLLRTDIPFPQIFEGLPDLSPEISNPLSILGIEDSY